MELADRYLNQMIRALTRFDGLDDFAPVSIGEASRFPKSLVASAVRHLLETRGLETVRRIRFDAEKRRVGRDWPFHADTMLGVRRLENIKFVVKTVVDEGVPGDLIETGVWRGGGSIMMRAALEAFGDTSRNVWCADSFEGLPPPDMDRYPQDLGMIWHTQSELAISLEQVQSNFGKYGLLDDRVRFLKGWFKDTLPSAPIDRLSVLRLDGDLYASTMDALNPLYDKVSPGGFVIVDDYGIDEDTCRRAIDDFRHARGITAPLQDVDWTCKFWRK